MHIRVVLIISIILSIAVNILGQDTTLSQKDQDREKIYYYWSGKTSEMTLQQLASYCAPIFWLSPDEPLLHSRQGKDIKIPQYFPFEEPADRPVVYYQLRSVLEKPGIAGKSFINNDDITKSVINLKKVGAVHLDYIHYYPSEVGTGRHEHDTEMVHFKIFIRHDTEDTESPYTFIFLQATATAHAVKWYENIYTVDTTNINYELELPFHVFVEEGKHASCTDMNGDGYYMPGFDVNIRTNDAWGIKDVVRTGRTFTSEYRGWMTKRRRPEHKVFPPLPSDSPLRKKYAANGIYAPHNVIYELRPMPSIEKALPDVALKNDMESYAAENWPLIKEQTDATRFFEWWETDQLIKSLSIAFRADNAVGLSFSFPLLITKNIEAPFIGGWLVNRIYLQDDNLRDFGYNLLYTPSASRFLDPYFAAGVEIDYYKIPGTNDLDSKTDFVFETGIKLRSTIKPTFLSFLSPITDFWGIRIGMKNKGFWDVKNLSYIFEIGAGVW